MDLGTRLKNIRKRKKMSQQDLANQVGLDRLTITKIETNRIKPSINTLERICSVLNVSLAQFFSGTEEGLSKDLIPFIEIVSEMNSKQKQQLLDIAKILNQEQ